MFPLSWMEGNGLLFHLEGILLIIMEHIPVIGALRGKTKQTHGP